MNLEVAFREAVGQDQPFKILALFKNPRNPNTYLCLWQWGKPSAYNLFNVSLFKLKGSNAILLRSSVYGLGMVEALELLIEFITTDKAYR